MTKLFYVDRAMCGGDELPEDFDLEEFCEVLQGKLPDVEVVPALEFTAGVYNREPQLISEQVFYEALGEYCHR